LDLPRDLAAEKTALLDAEAWLALVDAGEYAKAWDVASSAWKGQVTSSIGKRWRGHKWVRSASLFQG
jgi:hypothetical protein